MAEVEEEPDHHPHDSERDSEGCHGTADP